MRKTTYCGKCSPIEQLPVEVVPGKISGVPILKGARLPADTILENYERRLAGRGTSSSIGDRAMDAAAIAGYLYTLR